MPESESLLRTGEGFEAFYTRHYKLVYRTCYSYMRNTADAEDCTEDVFVKVLTGQYSFEDENHEKAWLTATAMNLCKDRLRHRTHRQIVSLDDCAKPVGAPGAYQVIWESDGIRYYLCATDGASADEVLAVARQLMPGTDTGDEAE